MIRMSILNSVKQSLHMHTHNAVHSSAFVVPYTTLLALHDTIAHSRLGGLRYTADKSPSISSKVLQGLPILTALYMS